MGNRNARPRKISRQSRPPPSPSSRGPGGVAPQAAPPRTQTRAARVSHAARFANPRGPIAHRECRTHVSAGATATTGGFHARAFPGAHVILARDDQPSTAPEKRPCSGRVARRIFIQRARGSARSPVDYTLANTYAQRAAAPGLVWYDGRRGPILAVAAGETRRLRRVAYQEDAIHTPSSRGWRRTLRCTWLFRRACSP